MKEIRETKLVEQTTIKFIADDGKEFTNEQDCKDYERRSDTEKCKKEFERLNPKYLDIPFADWGNKVSIYKVYLENNRDLQKVMDYEMNNGGTYFDEYVSEKTFNYPCNVIFYSADSFLDCVTDIESLINRTEKLLENLKS